MNKLCHYLARLSVDQDINFRRVCLAGGLVSAADPLAPFAGGLVSAADSPAPIAGPLVSAADPPDARARRPHPRGGTWQPPRTPDVGAGCT